MKHDDDADEKLLRMLG